MISLDVISTFEIVLLFIIWWLGLQILVRNPKNFTAITLSLLLFLVASFFIFDALSTFSLTIQQNRRVFIVYVIAVYLAVTFWFHTANRILPKEARKKTKWLVALAYLYPLIYTPLTLFTNSLWVFSQLKTGDFFHNFIYVRGPFYWTVAVYGIGLVIIGAYYFTVQLRQLRPFSRDWLKYFYPTLGAICYVLAGIVIIKNFYFFQPLGAFYFNILAAIGSLLIAYSVAFHGFIVGEDQLLAGKEFFRSSVVILFISFLYIVIIWVTNITFNYNMLLFTLILIPLLLTTHASYEWLSTFTRDIIYNPKSGLSVVTDTEVSQALRNYHRPTSLEDSSLLRLGVIQKFINDGEADDPIEALKLVIKQSVEFFKPEDDESRRTKQAIKYHLLKMLAFDQAEEGQMLWELGFEEYPVRIMSQEGKSRPPKLRITSPADYTATSRNAFINLKQEAIHDVTWRISYLEKLARKQ